MDQVAALLSGEQPWALLHGDCVEELRKIPDASVDAVVTDPPYFYAFMGKAWDSVGADEDEDDGGTVDDGKRMQVWHARWAGEVMRILKPGGHLLSFGGTRTYHRMVCAIEDAGFEIRDMIGWIHGQGFPKSMNASKAFDKEAGAKREVVGKYQPPSGQDWKLKQAADVAVEAAPGTFTASGRRTLDVTAPATEDAKKWDGWGTALKPAIEPILVARKPMPGNLISNLKKYGTGAINIDASRVGTDEKLTRVLGNTTESVSGWKSVNRSPVAGKDGGRWPANLVLEHSAECEKVGTRKVPTGTAVQRNRDGGVHNKVFGAYKKPSAPDVSYAGSDGTEEVAAWRCEENCPVRVLDAQSGEAGGFAPVPAGHQKDSKGVYGDFAALAESSQDRGTFYGDAGGASRFFFQASWRTTAFCCMLCECPFDAKSAGESSSRSVGMPKDAVSDSVPDAASELVLPGRGDSTLSESSSVGSVESGSRLGKATSLSSVRPDVPTNPDERLVRVVRSVAPLCGSCGIAIARSVAATQRGHDPASALGAVSTTDLKRQTLFRALVEYAVRLGQIGTIPTTDILSELFGSVIRATTDSTSRDTLGNDPLFRYEAKATTSERWIWCRVCKDAFSSDDAHVLHGRRCDECRVDYPRAENLGQMMVGSRAQVDGTGWRPKDAHLEHRTTTNIIQHPTQKAEDLMTWLVRLVTPPGGIVCDPFTGSGTTGVAALRGGFRFLGVEREPDYQRIAEKRIDYAKQMGHQPDLFGGGAPE